MRGTYFDIFDLVVHALPRSREVCVFSRGGEG